VKQFVFDSVFLAALVLVEVGALVAVSESLVATAVVAFLATLVNVLFALPFALSNVGPIGSEVSES